MGRYTSQSALIPRLMPEYLVAQLTQGGDGAADTIDTDVLAEVMEDAEAEVDGYLGVRFSLPLTAVPSVIAGIASRITRYKLYTTRGGEVEAWLDKDYQRAIEMLEEIRDGQLDVGLTAAGANPAVSQNADHAVRATSTAPVFGRSNMKGF